MRKFICLCALSLALVGCAERGPSDLPKVAHSGKVKSLETQGDATTLKLELDDGELHEFNLPNFNAKEEGVKVGDSLKLERDGSKEDGVYRLERTGDSTNNMLLAYVLYSQMLNSSNHANYNSRIATPVGVSASKQPGYSRPTTSMTPAVKPSTSSPKLTTTTTPSARPSGTSPKATNFRPSSNPRPPSGGSGFRPSGGGGFRPSGGGFRR